MDPKVQFIDDVKPLQDTQLYRVRGVEGVEWAVPLYKGLLKARLSNGNFQTCNLLGLDDATLIGGPPYMVEGQLSDLRQAEGVIVDEVGAAGKLAKILPDGTKVPLRIGDTMELNDRRATVVGICRDKRTFQSQPVVYTTYSRATLFAPRERKLLSFVLAKAKPRRGPQGGVPSNPAGDRPGRPDRRRVQMEDHEVLPQATPASRSTSASASSCRSSWERPSPARRSSASRWTTSATSGPSRRWERPTASFCA